MLARSACTSRSPGPNAVPSGLRKISAEDGQRASRDRSLGSEFGRIVGDRDTSARERDRGRDQVGQREPAGAVFLGGQREAGHRAGHADGERGVARLLRVGVAFRVEERLGVDRLRRGLAIVDGRILAAGAVDHHESAAAEIAGARIGHRHGEADRDRSVDRVAALLQDVDADAGGERLLRHHHPMRGGDGRRVSDFRRCAVVAARQEGQHQQGDEREGDPVPERTSGHGAN